MTKELRDKINSLIGDIPSLIDLIKSTKGIPWRHNLTSHEVNFDFGYFIAVHETQEKIPSQSLPITYYELVVRYDKDYFIIKAIGSDHSKNKVQELYEYLNSTSKRQNELKQREEERLEKIRKSR